MNALVTIGDEDAERRVLAVMRDSLYPGAREESVRMVLSYCQARGLDPMLKPVHIVPMYVDGGMRDVPLPGIALYRIQASRSGQYTGKSEPEFGPDVERTFTGKDRRGDVQTKTVTYPAWCRVTVRRGDAEFTAKEFWTENYATAGRGNEVPNEMWAKRPYGQLAKCAEAQALRMAFPELTGGDPTAEEMEGKSHPEPREVPNMASPRAAPAPVVDEEEFPWLSMDGKSMTLRRAVWQKALAKALDSLHDAEAIAEWRDARGDVWAAIPADMANEAKEAIEAHTARVAGA